MDNEVLEPNTNTKEPLLDKQKENKRALCFFIVVALIIPTLLILSLIFLTIKKRQGIILFDSESKFILMKLNQGIKKPLSDTREYRIIRLSNKLDAVLISDPKTTESSASLTVGVGSHMDKGVDGLAHFCEHMLFLGSKTFPQAGALDDYLRKHSGSNNAWTEGEKTTYYFTVNNAGLDKSLNIFSKMFSEPLFDKNYTLKEIEAVNSEHEKNLNSDEWKKMQLIKSFGNPNNSHSSFSTGNLETLKQAENINEKLLNLYEKYYISSNMKLTILSNGTLDNLQDVASKYFSFISNKKTNYTLYGNLETSEPFFRQTDLGKIGWYRKSSGADLNIVFSVDSVLKLYKSKPLEYFNYLFKYSGDKSLFSFLRKRKLATKIDSGIDDSYVSFATFKIIVELTDEGLNQIDFVIRLVFNYVNLIKSTPIQNSLLQEIEKINQLNFMFKDKEQDSSSYTAKISNKMFNFEYSDVLYGDYASKFNDEKLIKKYMNSLNAQNSIILIGSEKEGFPSDYLTDEEIKKEKWYKTEYLLNNLDEKIIKTLDDYPVLFEKSENVDPEVSFKIRKKNEFISNSNGLVKDCRESRDSCELDEYDQKKGDLTPITSVDDVNFKVFYKIDKSFKLPKVNIAKKLTSNNFNSNPVNYFYSVVLSNYIEYNLSFSLGDAMETGNAIKLDVSNDGILIDILAYSDLADKIVHAVSNEIFKFQPDPVVFPDIIEITNNNFKSVKKSARPFIKNSLYFKKMVKPNYILYTEILEIINSNQFNFHDFQSFVEDFKNELVMTVLIYGSIESEEVDRMTKDLRKYFPKTRLMDTSSLTKYSFQSNVGLHKEIDEMITLQIKNDADNQINHAVTNFYQIGLRDYEKSLYLGIIDKCIGNTFYHNLRTVEQLGYIVNSNMNIIDSVIYYVIVVQGSKLPPLEIAYEIDKVFLKALKKLEECSVSDYKEIIESIRSYLLKKDSNLNERSTKIWKEISINSNDFNRMKNLLETLEHLDVTKIMDLFKKTFFTSPKRLAIHNYASNVESFDVKSKESNIDFKEFHLNKEIQIKYTEDLNILNKRPILQKRKMGKKSNIKARLSSGTKITNQAQILSTTKMNSLKTQENNKMKIMKIQKLVKEFSEAKSDVSVN